MSFETTLAALTVALTLGLISLWQVRRKRKPGTPPWVPWHGILFVALLTLVVCLAHLPAAWPR